MTDIQKLQQAMLDDTAAHFKLGNRCVKNDVCVYSPTPESDGCAIGRKIEDKALCERMDNIGLSVGTSDVWNLLPDDLKKLGQQFLKDLQQLHDNQANWDANGLNQRGRDQVTEITTCIARGYAS